MEVVTRNCFGEKLTKMRDQPTGQRSDQEELEPEVGLEPTTCALRGGSTVSHSVPLSPMLSRSVLVREPQSRVPGTPRDSAGRAGTQLLGWSWDKSAVVAMTRTSSSRIEANTYSKASRNLETHCCGRLNRP